MQGERRAWGGLCGARAVREVAILSMTRKGVQAVVWEQVKGQVFRAGKRRRIWDNAAPLEQRVRYGRRVRFVFWLTPDIRMKDQLVEITGS